MEAVINSNASSSAYCAVETPVLGLAAFLGNKTLHSTHFNKTRYNDDKRYCEE